MNDSNITTGAVVSPVDSWTVTFVDALFALIGVIAAAILAKSAQILQRKLKVPIYFFVLDDCVRCRLLFVKKAVNHWYY